MDHEKFARQPWELHPRVALRPERFGAMAYHYDNRRLSFLKSDELVKLINELDEHPSARAAFDACGLDPRRWPSFTRALASLAESDMIRQASQETPSDQPTVSTQP